MLGIQFSAMSVEDWLTWASLSVANTPMPSINSRTKAKPRPILVPIFMLANTEVISCG